ncbi:CvpA family protein [Ligilactobacillus hayakitensis]|nr:CvpA family protein [Ligilactobacillus hayakitensis]
MLSLIILILLGGAFRYGYRVGIIQATVSLSGYISVFLLSIFFTKPVSNMIIKILSLNKDNLINGVFIKVLTFWLVNIIGGILFRIAQNTTNKIIKVKLISKINAIGGALFCTSMMYILVYFGILLLINWPNFQLQNSVNESILAQLVLKGAQKFFYLIS